MPTIVNGQINPTKKDNNVNTTNSKLYHIHNLLSESTVKVLNNKSKYSTYCKHKVLLMGESHLRGCAAKMIASLDARFDVCGVVKPGSVTGTLMETAKGDLGKLTMNDILIKQTLTQSHSAQHTTHTPLPRHAATPPHNLEGHKCLNITLARLSTSSLTMVEDQNM
jgi:hypothetical protein